MKAKALLVLILLIGSTTSPLLAVEDSKQAHPQRIRIGVDIRLGYQACIDFWIPITEHLSQAMPGYRFVVVPLASHQDLIRVLETSGIEFMSLDPAMEILAEDRFGAAPLATMIEQAEGESEARSAAATCSGVIIRRAERSRIAALKDIRGLRAAAVKPWSLTGWIAQWGLLVQNGIQPEKDLQQVAFLGTHGEVIQSILRGTADIGMVDADLLFYYGKNGRIAKDSLCVFDRKGDAIPLTPGRFISTTDTYPGRLISKAAGTSDELAKRVTDALLQKSLSIQIDQIPCTIQWAVASNTSKVRRLLVRLMGHDFAFSPGYPLPYEYPSWFYRSMTIVAVLAVTAILLVLMQRRYVRKADALEEQLEATHIELAETLAERQQVNAILARAGCGIDIIDDQNHIIFADPGIEARFGDWRGKKCHDYYCHSAEPCSACKMPKPTEEPRRTIIDLNGMSLENTDDPHAKVHFAEGEATRMIGIPFHDEGGRWLYARIHFPLVAFAREENMAMA